VGFESGKVQLGKSNLNLGKFGDGVISENLKVDVAQGSVLRGSEAFKRYTLVVSIQFRMTANFSDCTIIANQLRKVVVFRIRLGWFSQSICRGWE
jgi:hypothetical protein